MNVLVVGGSRFLGVYTGWRLLAAGHRVTLLNRGTRKDPFGALVERITADRRALGEALGGRRFDATVDLAAYEAEDLRAVVAHADQLGHYVFVSTGQVYLVTTGVRAPAREEDYDHPVMAEPAGASDREEWKYGVDKRACEDLLVASGMRATRLRIPMVNGPGDHKRRFEGYVRALVAGREVILPDGGHHPCRHVYAPAVARAIARLVGDERTFGRAWNLSQREEPTLRELLERVAAIAGATPRFVDVPRAELADPKAVSPFSGTWMSRLDPSRAEAELGFTHEPLDVWLTATVTSYLAPSA